MRRSDVSPRRSSRLHKCRSDAETNPESETARDTGVDGAQRVRHDQHIARRFVRQRFAEFSTHASYVGHDVVRHKRNADAAGSNPEWHRHRVQATRLHAACARAGQRHCNGMDGAVSRTDGVARGLFFGVLHHSGRNDAILRNRVRPEEPRDDVSSRCSAAAARRWCDAGCGTIRNSDSATVSAADGPPRDQ